MNLAEPLPDNIELEYHDDVWQQPIDYEHIPFRCRKCHEYGHLYRQCPLNKEEELKRSQEEHQRNTGKTEETDRGFQPVTRRKRQSHERPQTQTQEKPSITISQNKFRALQSENKDYEVNLEDDEDPGNTPMDIAGENKGKDANSGQIIGERMEGKVEDTAI